MAAMSFTAVSYGRMAAAYPEPGSTYTFASKALHPNIGFFAGWGMILDYILIPLLSIIYVALAGNRLLPTVPYVVWVVLTTIAITAINLVGGIAIGTARGSGLVPQSVSIVAQATESCQRDGQQRSADGYFSPRKDR